jgi:hypothetical protein
MELHRVTCIDKCGACISAGTCCFFVECTKHGQSNAMDASSHHLYLYLYCTCKTFLFERPQL